MGAAFESSILASRTSAEPAVMSLSDQPDFCPNCRSPFEIVRVKFSFNGTAMIVACPNCAMACNWRAAESKILDNAETLAINAQGFWHGIARMASFEQRFRYALAFLIGAVITAPWRSCLWRVLSRRDSRGCANGHSSRCARNNFLPKNAPPQVAGAASSKERPQRGLRIEAVSFLDAAGRLGHPLLRDHIPLPCAVQFCLLP
jgi:hypothetical protein